MEKTRSDELINKYVFGAREGTPEDCRLSSSQIEYAMDKPLWYVLPLRRLRKFGPRLEAATNQRLNAYKIRQVRHLNNAATLDTILEVIDVLETLESDDTELDALVHQIILPELELTGIIPSIDYISPHKIITLRDDLGYTDNTEFSKAIFQDQSHPNLSSVRSLVSKMIEGPLTAAQVKDRKTLPPVYRYSRLLTLMFVKGVNALLEMKKKQKEDLFDIVDPHVASVDEMHQSFGMKALSDSEGNILEVA